MMPLFVFAFGAWAHDLEIAVKVPGAEPVWTTILDVRPGSTQTITFPGDGRTRFSLKASVEEPTDGYDWRVTFELASWKGGRGTPAVITRPTMQAHTNQLARFTFGGSQPVLGSEAPAVTFHGYEITWVVTEEGGQ